MRDEPQKPPESEERTTSEWVKFTGLGVEFIAAVLVCTAIGYGLDRWLNASPWLLLTGVGVGFAVGLMQMIRGAQKIFHD